MAKKKMQKLEGFFSTNPDYKPDFLDDDDDLEETPAPENQLLYVSIDRKQRKGKTATLIEGFIGHPDDLKDLGKELKSKCGVGGSAKDDVIIIQGEVRDKVMGLLEKMGYKVKRKGG